MPVSWGVWHVVRGGSKVSIAIVHSSSVLRAARALVRQTSPIAFLARKFIREAACSIALSEFTSDGLCIDVGAGTSPYRQEIEKFLRAKRYVAFDLAISDTTNVAGDAMRMPFLDGCAQFVTSFDVLQHIQDSNAVLSEAARILAPGGLLLLTFPFNYCECDVQDFRRWTLSGMSNDIGSCGLDVLYVEQRGGRFFAFACILNWIMQHIVPGQRRDWRQKRSLVGLFRSALLIVLTIPTTALQWLMLGLDYLLPNQGCYMGGMLLATKRTPENELSIGRE